MNSLADVRGRSSLAAALFLIVGLVGASRSMGQAAAMSDNGYLQPLPLTAGAQVVTLWPAGSPQLKKLAGYDQPEKFQTSQRRPGYVSSITNIHNPSIEVHLAPADKSNGLAIILAAGGGNNTLNVGTEGTDIAVWLNSLGVSCFIERYRLKPYNSATDALADTQQSFRVVRAHAAEWKIDPKRVGIMGFSAGGEQSARVAMNFDEGNPKATDPVERQSSRPDFTVLIYAGWAKPFDLSKIPANAPPAFGAVAGVDDYFHSSETIDFTSAWMLAKIPVELHIYGHGGHANGISPRNGIPFGTWQFRFVDWITDLGMMKPAVAAVNR